MKSKWLAGLLVVVTVVGYASLLSSTAIGQQSSLPKAPDSRELGRTGQVTRVAFPELWTPELGELIEILNTQRPVYRSRILIGRHNHNIKVQWDVDFNQPAVEIDGVPADDCTFETRVDAQGRLTWQWGLALPGVPMVEGSFAVATLQSGDPVPIALIESSGEGARLAPDAPPTTGTLSSEDTPIASDKCGCFRGGGSCTIRQCEQSDHCGRTGICMLHPEAE